MSLFSRIWRPLLGRTRKPFIFTNEGVSRHVALKLFIDSKSIGSGQETELDMYKRIEKSSKDHPGRDAVRSRKWTAGMTSVSCPPSAWESVLGLRHRNSLQRFRLFGLFLRYSTHIQTPALIDSRIPSFRVRLLGLLP
ncbi:predicted protein [Plenodomus lingam JN3]|uniref:Predicted protein n=1 Tax=Leptosphaeria maculans (strain JN3 / isolate v23.1.3 / race Av1-4-5-6-7-8) TaxID=985895 RepID=E5A3E4_LEPMJ|nr:predicted protein [Plenodomus lingam JN3]CBX98157.1 predicted protein [Plenodomus lingam JN3]